jgi:hypothetical protein
MKITPFLRENGTQTFQARLRFDESDSEEHITIIHDKSYHTPILNLKKCHLVDSLGIAVAMG